MRMRRWVGRGATLALCVMAACSGTEPLGPAPDAGLAIEGDFSPLEAEFSRTLVAFWAGPSGKVPATNVTWRSSKPGVAIVDANGFVTGVSAGMTTISAETGQGQLTASVSLEVLPLAHYSKLELQVFNELVFGGNAFRTLRKWGDAITLQVSGDATAADRAIVDSVVAEMTALLRTIPVSVVEHGGNVQVSFTPDAQFGALAGGACAPPAGVWGYSCPTSDAASRYTQAIVYVSSTRSLDIRRYLIRHELMHMVGFYGHPTGVPSVLNRPEQITLDHFLSLDLALMEMMGRPELSAGMRGAEAMVTLSELRRYE
jgi:hypothetical protein